MAISELALSCSRRDFLRGLVGLGAGALSESDTETGKEKIYPFSGFGFLCQDLPAYKREEDGLKRLLEGTFFPKGCLLRLNRLVNDGGLLGDWWLGVKQDSWLYYPKAIRAQKNLLIPFDWGKIAVIGPRSLQPIRSLKDPLKSVVPADKRIEVDLGNQTLTAFEGDETVLTSMISSGLYDLTPRGKFFISAKTPSRYMQGRDFDLPGVGYVSLFTEEGISFHSTLLA